MFDGHLPGLPKIEHVIPEDDDLVHVESMDCPCGPFVHAMPGIG